MSLSRLAFFVKNSIPLLLLVSLSACATVKPPLTGIVIGREVETLQSSISISMQAGERSSGGRAYLIFKHPDRFHLAVLSPFGPVVLELFSDHHRLTCLVPSKQTAYSGLFSELPESSALKNMELMKWVVEPPPVLGPPSARREMRTASGDRFYFDQEGLLERKLSEQGDQVEYEDRQVVNGVAFPNSIVIKNRYGATVRIVFDDPQINQPVEDATLSPNLEGFKILPLGDLKGF